MDTHFAFGSFLSKAATPLAESFLTVTSQCPGRVESGGGSTDRVYSTAVVNVAEKCLGLIGRPKRSVSLKPFGDCKHEGKRVDWVGHHLVVVNAAGNAVTNMMIH